MGYLLGFSFIYLGYAIVVKSAYTWQHKPVSLWYLLTGQGQKFTSSPSALTASGDIGTGAQNLGLSAASAAGNVAGTAGALGTAAAGAISSGASGLRNQQSTAPDSPYSTGRGPQ